MNKNILTCTQLHFVCYDSNLILSYLHSEYMYIERANLPAFPEVFSFALGPPPFVLRFLLFVGQSPITSFQNKIDLQYINGTHMNMPVIIFNSHDYRGKI